MLIINTSYEALVKALADCNLEQIYNGNIAFKKIKPVDSKDVSMATRFNVTLKVLDCRGPGSRWTDSRNNRRSSSACWHVYGDFIDSLNEEASVKSSWIGQHGKWVHPGDKWNRILRWDGGFQYELSDLCEC